MVDVKLTQDQIDWIGYFVTEAIGLSSESDGVVFPPTQYTKDRMKRANEALEPLGIHIIWDEDGKDYVYENH